MKFRIQVPIVVSADVSEKIVDGTRIVVIGSPVAEAGTMAQSFDTPILPSSPLYDRVVEQIARDATRFFEDKAKEGAL